MLGIGLRTSNIARWRRATAGSPPAFSPLDLPLAAWYDPSDISTLFQDTAGTVPVSADGDHVALMLDKSGNGHHMSQSDATRQPVYHMSNGQHWIESDGIDDSMSTASRMGLSANPDLTVIAGLQPPTQSGSTARLFHFGNASAAGTLSGALGTGGVSWRHNDGNSIFAYNPPSQAEHIIASWARSANTTYGQSRFRMSGHEEAFISGNWTTRSPNDTQESAYLFARGNTTSNTLNIRMHGLIIGWFSDLSNIEAAETWMANQLGVALS